MLQSVGSQKSCDNLATKGQLSSKLSNQESSPVDPLPVLEAIVS